MTQNPDARPATPSSLAGLRAGADVGGYRLLRRLGAGGMGVVWEVADAEGNHVAMKILHPQIAADPMARRRLDREANVLARVKDSRVARILDIETGDGADGSGVTFVITELIDGPTLQHEVDHEGAYDLTTDARDLADLAHGLVDSLTSVHAAGVIHRDLKPSNVMLGAQGPVLIDFGIAQVADDVRLTQTGQVTGTPGFIPPEMLDGGEPTPDVDWYACAGVLLFAVTGLSPFGSGPWQAVFRRVYAGTPELGDLERTCPALARAFTAALAPELKDRLSVEDLLLVLDEIAEGGSGEAALTKALGPAAPQERDRGAAFGSAGSAGSAPETPSGAYGYMSGPVRQHPGPGPGMPSSSASSASSASTGSGLPVSFAPGAGTGASGGSVPPTYSPAAHSAPSASSQVRPQPQMRPQPPMRPQPQMRPQPPMRPQPQMRPQPPMRPHPQSPARPRPQMRPQRAAAAGSPSGASGKALDWAREPVRRPGLVASIAALLVGIGMGAPSWVVILAGFLLIVVGTVGRADDARRWRRLRHGGVRPNDNARMWAFLPKYILASLLFSGFALLFGGLLWALVISGGGYVLGLLNRSTPMLFSTMSTGHRMGLLGGLATALYLLVIWFVPWGAPNRRGAAHTIEVVTRSDSVRLVLVVVILAAALGFQILFLLDALPWQTFEPIISAMP